MIKIKPSKRNTNKHTNSGMMLLEKSIDTVGVIESISVATDGTIISGHARKEIFDKKGMVAKHIKLEQNEYAVLDTNIENDTPEYYKAQILANTTANANFDLDTEFIEELAIEYDIEVDKLGFDLSISLEDINKKDFSDKEFENEFNRIKNENAATPIVANFNEKNELFLIPIDNEIDELFIRELFKLNEIKQFNTIKGKSNIITIENIKCLIQNLSK